MNRTFELLMIVALATGGCDEPFLEDALEVSLLDNSVQVETDCDNGGCSSVSQISFTLGLDSENALPENDEVEFLQYRVDYNLVGIGDALPYFAAPMEMVIHNNETAMTTIQVAGSRQREFLLAQELDGPVSGTALVTLAGYDEENTRVDFEFGFNIQFGDYITSEGDSDSEAPEGEQP